MTTLAGLVTQNTKNFLIENNKRGASIVRVCGEEHNATASAGVATVYLTHDNDLCYISDLKFKIVMNGGGAATSPSAPVSANIVYGTNSWANLEEFLAEYPLGSAIDVDGIFGAQCIDYANAFWVGQVGRTIKSGGENAKGVWTSKRYENAGTEFTLVTSWNELQRGDWIVWGDGAYGHIALALSAPEDGTVTVWDQNGSGYAWPSGGKTLSQDTIARGDFLGAFRYNW